MSFSGLCAWKSYVSNHAAGVPSDVPSACTLKFLLLNPAVYFDEILRSCRAVIVAGGTMGCMEDFQRQLVSPDVHLPQASILLLYAPTKQKPTGKKNCFVPFLHFLGPFISEFGSTETPSVLQIKCCRFDHVVDPSHVRTFVISGTAQCAFKFTMSNRTNERMVLALGQTLLDLAAIVPGGIVVFFPSYSYEEYVHGLWQRHSLLSTLEHVKQVFREPRESSELEAVLRAYSHAITAGPQKGAVLFSVVGGKMSEGINFKDDMGRCVFMVGLPYPNRESAELKEKMKFLDTKYGAPAGQVCTAARLTLYCQSLTSLVGTLRQPLYEGCQPIRWPCYPTQKCVGSPLVLFSLWLLSFSFLSFSLTIAMTLFLLIAPCFLMQRPTTKKSDDYACILLADERYRQMEHWSRLPQWIKPPDAVEEKAVCGGMTTSGIQKAVGEFFQRQKDSH